MTVGIIGCGRVCNDSHIVAYNKYNVKIAALCDIIPERVKLTATKVQGCKIYNHHMDLARDKDVKIIDIATQPYGRLELISDLIKYKKPLLIQKPIAYNRTEAYKIAKIIQESGIKASINHNARFAPINLKLMEWTDNSNLGKIYQIHHVNRFNEDINSWYTDVDDYIFLDHGIHYIDLIRKLSRSEVISVSAISNKKPKQIAKCNLNYAVNILFKNDIIASLYFNNAVPTKDFYFYKMFVDGEKGSVCSTLDKVSACLTNGKYMEESTTQNGWVPDGFYGSYRSLIESIEKNIEPYCSVEDHLKSLEVAFACCSSARNQGQWVKIV